MAINYSKLFNWRRTSQSAPIPGTDQVKNSGGGYSWEIDDWTRLDRFLVLGAEGGTYYIREQELVKQNHDAIVRCIQQDGVRAVNRIVEISDSGRAPRNDPAIFALALAVTHGDAEAKAQAFANLRRVCRIGTHMFHFAEYVNAMRGWGRGLRKAVGRWYIEPEVDKLAYQAVKYQSRDGWSHRDLLRLAHPKAPTPQHAAVYRWMLKGDRSLGERVVKRTMHGEPRLVKYEATGEFPRMIQACEQAKRASNKSDIVNLITEFDLPREAVPTRWLNELEVWEALLARMPMTALIRNLGKMSSVGLIKPFSNALQLVLKKLRDEKALQRARVHPLAIIMAQKIYARGYGHKGSLQWNPSPLIVDALDEAFYASFQNVVPCGKPILLALDVSGSMAHYSIADSCISARDASAALALITAATEPDYHIMGFSSRFVPVKISPRMRLDEVIRKISNLPFEATDCALPMIWARENRVKVAGFVTYTDSETWFGHIHPSQALNLYRRELVPNAKSIVVGMTSNGFTIADPKDRGMLDVVGFDTTVPTVISDFVRE